MTKQKAARVHQISAATLTSYEHPLMTGSILTFGMLNNIGSPDRNDIVCSPGIMLQHDLSASTDRQPGGGRSRLREMYSQSYTTPVLHVIFLTYN